MTPSSSSSVTRNTRQPHARFVLGQGLGNGAATATTAPAPEANPAAELETSWSSPARKRRISLLGLMMVQRVRQSPFTWVSCTPGKCLRRTHPLKQLYPVNSDPGIPTDGDRPGYVWGLAQLADDDTVTDEPAWGLEPQALKDHAKAAIERSARRVACTVIAADGSVTTCSLS